MRGGRAALSLVSFCIVAAGASAAAGPPMFAGVCADLPDGTPVRLARLDGGTVEGRAAGWDGARLQLLQSDGAVAVCAESEAAALWVRRVRTAGGLKWGALTGGAVSGLGMALLLVVLNSVDDDGVGEAGLPLMLLSIGAGAGVGALVGGVTGSSLPVWDLRWARSGWPGAGGPAAAAPALSTGGLELLLGAVGARDWPQQDGPAYGVRWRAELSPRWSAALEAARFHAEPVRAIAVDPSGHREGADDCRHAGALLQFDLATGGLRPYLVGGLGVYWWEENYLGYGWGCGLEGDCGRRTVGRLEIRRHGNVQRLVETDPVLVSVQIGIGRSW